MQSGGEDKRAGKDGLSASGKQACQAECKDNEQHCNTTRTLQEHDHSTEPEQKERACNAETGTSIKDGVSSMARSEAPRGASSEALAQLTAMGFSESQARSALHATNSVERAANWLLLGQRS